MPPTIENKNTSPVISIPQGPTDYSRLVLLALIMIFTSLLTAGYFLNKVEQDKLSKNVVVQFTK